jgi:hypothetical protein
MLTSAFTWYISVATKASDVLTDARLVLVQKRLRVAPFTRKSERSEVLAPRAFWNHRICLDPFEQAREIPGTYFAQPSTVEEMIPDSAR